jgi:cell division septation protein DedD
MRDQEVHEIQLNGKQLVFMFMAATVVSVVIFLCGVMVGRGVRPPQLELLAAGNETAVDPTALIGAASTRLADPAPAPAQESLTYAEHLEAPVAPNEPLKPSEPPEVSRPAVPQKTLAPPKAEQGAGSASLSEPGGNGFVVQVMAFPTRPEADALARRLTAKGYPTFVTLNDAAPRAKYRVRVGKYPTKRDADAISARLQQEERFKPWVTR